MGLCGCQGFYSARDDGGTVNKIDAVPIPTCPNVANDSDCDNILNKDDNCPTVSSLNREDEDLDGIGDVCDNCIGLPNSGSSTGTQPDGDIDGIGDACDPQQGFQNTMQAYLVSTSSFDTSIWQQIPMAGTWDVTTELAKSKEDLAAHILIGSSGSTAAFTALEIGFNIGDSSKTLTDIGAVIENAGSDATGMYCGFASINGTSFTFQSRKEGMATSRQEAFALTKDQLVVVRASRDQQAPGSGELCQGLLPLTEPLGPPVIAGEPATGQFAGMYANNRKATLRYMVVYH
jgi:hypothetical protein